MTLAIGDKVRLKRTYRIVNPLPIPAESLVSFSLPDWFLSPSNEYSVSGVSSLGVRLSSDRNWDDFWVTRDSVEKVEDKPVNERVLRTMKVNAVGADRCGKYFAELRGDNKLEWVEVDFETAKTIRVGDEYEVIIRRK